MAAASQSLPPLSNMDIIKLTRGIGQDDYYRLGRVLGFDDNILDHLWEADKKGCTLQVLLLWRDGLAAEDDQRETLAEKLSEVGLEYKRECLLSGFPASPGPYPPSPGHYTTSNPAPISPQERTKSDPTATLEALVLPLKQTKGDDKEPHPSAVAGRTDEEFGGISEKPEQSVKESISNEIQCTEAVVPGHTGSLNDEDMDGSDSEAYENISKKTLQRGSVSVAFIRSKPKFSFHGTQDNGTSKQRNSLVMEAKPLVSPSKLDDTTTQERAEQYVSENANVDQEAIDQYSAKQGDGAQETCTLNKGSLSNSESTPGRQESSKPLRTKLERPFKPLRKGIAPLVLSPAHVAVNHNPDQSPDPPCQQEAPTHQNTMSNDNESEPSSSQQGTVLLNRQVSSMDKPVKEKPGDSVKAGNAPLPVDENGSRYKQQSPPPVSPPTHLTLPNGNKAQHCSSTTKDKKTDETRATTKTIVQHTPIKPSSLQLVEEGYLKKQPLASPRSLAQQNTTPNHTKDNRIVLSEYKLSPQPKDPDSTLSSQDLTDKGKLSKSIDNLHQPQPPSTPASVMQSKSGTEIAWERQEHMYASIGEESTNEMSPQLKQEGPSVAPYKPRTQEGSEVSSDLQDLYKGHTGSQESSDVNPRQQKPPPISKTAPGRGTRQRQPSPDKMDQQVGGLSSTPMATNKPNARPQGTSFQIQQGIGEDVLRALAADITTDGKCRTLGIELGLHEAEINGFEAMNQRTNQRSSQGTLEMLLKWGSNVSSEDQSLLLKHALRRAGLVKMADTHLKASKRRRDIRGVKIAKYFTVSDCREKLEFHYRIDTCTILKKHDFLNSSNQFPVIVAHRLVKRGKNLFMEKVPLEGSVNGILKARKDDALPMRIVVFAPPGLGKSTLVAQIAHDWAERVPGSTLQDVSLLFVLKMKSIGNHGSLGQAIVNQLLSDVRGLTPQSIDQFIEDNQSECMVVLDGLDEFKGEISSIKCGHVLRVVQNIQLKKCRVVVTSLPRLEDYFNKEDLPKDFLKMELQGLSPLQSTSFIRSFFRENRMHKADELLVFLRTNVVINELLATPLFCLLVCHLWESNLLQLVTTESEFYDSVNRFFLRHGEEKASIASGDTDLDVIVQGLGEVALHGKLEDPHKRSFGQSDFKKIPANAEKAIALGIICKGKSKKRENTNMEFYHHNAQEHCVAKYLSMEVTVKSTKGKPSRQDKALRQMTKKNLVDYGRVLRFTAGLGSPATGLQVIEAIHAAENIQLGDKSRMILDCLAEIPHLDTQTSYAVERCFAGGNILLNLPTLHTMLGFIKLPVNVKERVRSVTIHSSFMPPHVAKSLSVGLQACPDLLKLEVANVQNPTYPVILLLANKLSVHLSPEGALSVLPDLSQMVFNGLRLVNLSGCHLSSEATRVLWATLARCPHIDEMTVKNSAILGRDLPRLGCITVLQANLKTPFQSDEVNWLSSILGDAEHSPEVRLTIGDAGDGTIRRVGVGIQEHILMAEERVDLTNATGNTIKILNVLPDSFRRKIRTLCIKQTRFTEDLTLPLLDTVHSLIRLETFTTENCKIPDELKQLQVFKGSFQSVMGRDLQGAGADAMDNWFPYAGLPCVLPEDVVMVEEVQVNELPALGQDGVLRGSVSSPLREEELERLSSAMSRTTTLQEVHLVIEHHRKSETDFQELMDITGDNMELCNVSSATIEILKMLPASFKQQMHSARIRNCNLTDELSHLLSETLQTMDELEMFLSENSTLHQKSIHLTNVTVIDLGRFASMCFDWEWLDNAGLLEELHLTFASSSSLSTTPSSSTSLSIPTTPTTPTSPTSPKGALPIESGPIYQDVPDKVDASTDEETFEEDFYLKLAYGRLVMSRMSSCSLSVMLHLPAHLKNELQHVRIRSTKLTVDVLNQFADVLKSFEHLWPLSLQTLYRRPIKFGCILHPGAIHPVVGQWD